MTELAEAIRALREQGHTYNQIKAELGCSKGTISYYLADGSHEKNLQRQRDLRAENDEAWLAAKKASQDKYREKNRERLREQSRAERVTRRIDIFNHYGTECARCGFDDLRALQIDHIDDNGAEERKSLGGQQFSGHRFYKFLQKNGYPEGYQTLCANCNNIKQVERNEALWRRG